MNQDTNRTIHLWLGKCWHKREVGPTGTGGFKVKMKCIHCGDSRYRSYCTPNPAYDSDPAAMVELLEAVKNQKHHITFETDEGHWVCCIYRFPGMGRVYAAHPLLPSAVAAATLSLIKAIEAEARA